MAATVSLAVTAGDRSLDRLRTRMNAARDLAEQLERGHAALPLRDYFETLAESTDAAPFTVTLLSVDAASRAVALGWVCGKEYPLHGDDVPVATGFEPSCLEVAAPPGLQGLRLLLPESVAAVVANHALLAWLRSESHVVAIAGPADCDIDSAATEVIRSVADGAVASWAITCGAVSEDRSGGGWAGLLEGSGLAAVHVSPGAAPPLPEFVLDRRSAVRQRLFACQRARRFASALEMLQDRIEDDIRQRHARSKALSRRASAVNGADPVSALHEALAAIQSAWTERKTAIKRELVARNVARRLPASVANNKIDNLVQDLTTDDIAQQRCGSIIELSTVRRVVEEVNALIGDLVRADLCADLEWLNHEVTTLTQEASLRLEALGGGSIALRPETLDESALWKPLTSSLQFVSHYSGKLAQRGWRERSMEFFSHARVPSLLVGGVVAPFLFFPEYKEGLLKLSPLFLTGGIVWACLGTKEEKHKALELEAFSMRKQLAGEIRSLYQQWLHDWSNRADQHLETVGNRIRQALEAYIRGRVADQKRISERDRVDREDKLNADNIRLRELGRLRDACSELRQATREA
jgi:hypothetical protein